MMNVHFYIDPELGYPHIHTHGVDEHEVEDVIMDPSEDRRGSGGSRIAIGQTRGGRYIKVVYLPDPNVDGAFVITAYELRGKQLSAYRRRSRRRGG